MKLTRDNHLTNILFAAFISATAAVSVVQMPAMSYVSDPMVIHQLEDQRRDLLLRESNLLQDRDGLNRQIDRVRRNNDFNSKRVYSDLCRQLDQKYKDLQDTRQAIRDVEKSLI